MLDDEIHSGGDAVWIFLSLTRQRPAGISLGCFDSGMMVAQNAKNVMEPQVQLRQFFIKNTFHIFCERCFALVANLANYTSKNLPKRVQPVKIKAFFQRYFHCDLLGFKV